MDASEKIPTLTVHELMQLMQQGQSFVLVDTLTADHFAKVHLPGALNACVFEVVFPVKIQELFKDRAQRIIVYGSSGTSRDAIAAADKLARLAYQNVAVLAGGMKAWRDAGYPLEGEDPRAVDEAAPLRFEKRIYVVDTERSLIEWTGRNPGTTHYGNLPLAKGELRVEDGVLSGSFEMDIRSIKNLSLQGDELQPVLIAHLLSDDFFFAERFPIVRFQLDAGRQLPNVTMTAPNYLLEGTLSMRGATGKLQFPATVNVLSDGNVVAEAHFDIDRTQWNIIYGSSRFFEHLGMHLVFDLISLQVRIAAH